jgi:hypothetical protein
MIVLTICESLGGYEWLFGLIARPLSSYMIWSVGPVHHHTLWFTGGFVSFHVLAVTLTNGAHVNVDGPTTGQTGGVTKAAEQGVIQASASGIISSQRTRPPMVEFARLLNA